LIIVKNEKLKNTTLKEQFPKSNIKIVERDKIETPNKQIHDHCLFWLGTVTSIKSDGVKLLFMGPKFQ
jgi:hypothetical protein